MSRHNAKYFSIGEVVIMQSKDHPEINGTETTVLDAGYQTLVNARSGELRGWYYQLDLPAMKEGKRDWWHQSALRKKHKGGSLSLQDIIRLCNSGSVHEKDTA